MKDKSLFEKQNRKIIAKPIKSDLMALAGLLHHKAIKPTPKNIHKLERAAAIKAIADNAAKEAI